MKKLLALFACLCIFGLGVFAEPLDNNDFLAMEKFEEEKLQEKIVVPEEQHCVDKNAKVSIVYRPAYHEAYIYYETLYFTYDEGEARNTVLACLEDFVKDNGYKHYEYMEADKTKYKKSDRGNRAIFSSKVKLTY